MIRDIIKKVRIKPLNFLKPKSVYKPNRRNAPRANARNLMKCLRGDDVPKEFVANLTNLSETGIQFTSGYLIQKGALLKIMLNVPEKHRVISALGKCAWVAKVRGHQGVYRIGAAFITLAAEDRESLRELVKEII